MATKKTDNKPEPKEEDPKKSSRKVNDIAKPGETAADPTSRPIITPHGGMIKQDPMVSGESNSGETEEANQKEEQSNTISKSKIKLEPDSKKQDEPSQEDKSQAEEPKTENDTEEDKPEEAKPEGPKESAENDKQTSDDEDHKADNEAIGSLASSAGGKKVSAKEKEEEQKKNEKVQELIASKRYNVSIVEGGHKASSERFVSWLLLFLLTASIGVYLAIDAGYLDAGVALPYDFISN